ncbi:MAG: magnesium chelatase [Gammaproteobacteria bacterium]|nr:MAG: magnesium chelatase [Pseudomonadota bacterium]PIE38044.1 MAG: magnesium chelatase [Gammaproteobacteria bacterium]
MVRTHHSDRLEMPFSAVIGQDRFKLALALVAINPAIGGVLISGPRGSAKSTLARGLAAILPVDPADRESDAKAPPSFVTLPLGASEEMLVGTLNLEKVLNDRQLSFSPGLLSKAHKGVLYVDEVNLLPDNLVDLLLDVAASGVNYIERDGISHQHPAEFVLVGTMNPDEGELRPQLLDRFGLSVALTNRYEVAERVAIVKAREAFDADPNEFILACSEKQSAIVARIATARGLLSKVTCSEAIRIAIAERCEQAGVDGLRADIVWYRTALAHAAWQGRTEVLPEDIDTVAELVLHHRRHQGSPPPPSRDNPERNEPTPDNKPPGKGFERPDDSHRQSHKQAHKQSHKQNNPNESGSGEGDWGSMEPRRMQGIVPVDRDILADADIQDKKQTSVILSSIYSKHKGSCAQGRSASNTRGHFPDWFTTLINNPGEWPPNRLIMRKLRQGQPVLHIVLFDTSGSTLQGDVFARAKGVVATLAHKAYLNREQLAIFGFGNNQVKPLMAKVRAPKQIETWLEQLTAGGGTPLLKGIHEVAEYGRLMNRRHPELGLRFYIVSDGRSRDSLARTTLPGECVWVDTEQAVISRGRGEEFAGQLGAFYLSLKNALLPNIQGHGGTA